LTRILTLKSTTRLTVTRTFMGGGLLDAPARRLWCLSGLAAPHPN
jgi:hypothetical protein